MAKYDLTHPACPSAVLHGKCTTCLHMLHSSTLVWGYLLLIGGVVILAVGVAGLIHGARSSRSPEELLLRRRMRMLAALMQTGQISREEYNRRRTEILVQRYKKHAA